MKIEYLFHERDTICFVSFEGKILWIFFFWFPHHFEQGQSRAVIPCYLEHSPKVFISVTSCPERSEVWLRKLFAGNVVIYGKTYSFYTLALPAVWTIWAASLLKYFCTSKYPNVSNADWLTCLWLYEQEVEFKCGA